jgi:hypothetical protein
MIDYAKVAAETTVASEPEFPTVGATTRRQPADPALVQLVTDAAKDGKRRELPGRYSVTPYEGRKHACEAGTVAGELHRAAREVGVKLAVRRFDATDKGVRLTFKVRDGK